MTGTRQNPKNQAIRRNAENRSFYSKAYIQRLFPKSDLSQSILKVVEPPLVKANVTLLGFDHFDVKAQLCVQKTPKQNLFEHSTVSFFYPIASPVP